MTTLLEPPPQRAIIYPESDGQPMADNTLQFTWITVIKENCEVIFRNDPNVFVAGDLLWYPVEGKPDIRVAPDVLIAVGRPKGYRGSYMQWVEGDIPPQVVFEVLSPGNTIPEMTRKFAFFNRYGAEEYYLFDPYTGEISGWVREEGTLVPIEQMDGWVSPRLGVRFETHSGELVLYRPDGQRFLTFVELHEFADQAIQRAEATQVLADADRARVERLQTQLRVLGIEPEV